MLISRKANEEGHSADALADALSRILLTLRFIRRADPHVQSVKHLMDSFMEGVGEEAVNGCTVTADRRYGK